MSQVSVIVGIGRGKDLSAADWKGFVDATGILLAEASIGRIQAAVQGQAWSVGWGTEDAVWWAVQLLPDALSTLEDDLAILARLYRQDAIAITVGETRMVKPAPEPDYVPQARPLGQTPSAQWVDPEYFPEAA